MSMWRIGDTLAVHRGASEWAQREVRHRRVLARALLALLFCGTVASCSRVGGGDEDSVESEAQPGTSREEATVPNRVELSIEAQRLLDLQVQQLEEVTLRAEVQGFGRVLDPAPLAALVAERATAQGTLEASEQERTRLEALQRQDNASARAVQAAEAAAVRDRWLVQSASDRIALGWGQALAERHDLPTLLEALTAQTREIVRIDVPAGEPLPDPTRPARLVTLADEARSGSAEWLGWAPTTDPRLQGRGVLYLTADNRLGLTVDSAVDAWLPVSGEPLSGVQAPRSAVLRYAAHYWVYVQTAPTVFERIALTTLHPMPDGWLVPSGLTADARVVTKGAQVLLSEELKAQVRLGD